ncbi:MAG: hypothetical protein ABR955_04045 [Verrucomicrobiota bacterium]
MLVYTILGVKVSGRNLQPVIMALLAGTADFIQEYDRTQWPKPADAQAPLIESIEVVVQDTAQPAAHTGAASCRWPIFLILDGSRPVAATLPASEKITSPCHANAVG